MKKFITLSLIVTTFAGIMAFLPEKTKAVFEDCNYEQFCYFNDVAEKNADDWEPDLIVSDPTEQIQFHVGYWNSFDEQTVNNVTFKSELPEELEYIPGSLYVQNNTDKDISADEIALFSENGWNIGTLKEFESVGLYFDVNIKQGLDAGTYTFTHNSTLKISGETYTDDASVRVTYEPPVEGGGIAAAYYNNMNLYGSPVVTRVEPLLDTTNPGVGWDLLGTPVNGVNSDNFSVIWTGQVHADHTQTYTFYTNSDDGIRVWIDDTLIIDEWYERGQPEPDDSGTIALTAGWHNVRVEYFEHVGGSIAQLFWSSANQTGGVKQIVPQNKLRTQYNANVNDGLFGEYFDNREVEGDPVATRVDRGMYFIWGFDEPLPGVGTERYSIRWTGQIRADFTETYTFCSKADDGTRLWIDNFVVFDRWYPAQSQVSTCSSIELTAGWHDIRLDYFNFTVWAAMFFQWNSPSQTGGTTQNIPADKLRNNYGGLVDFGIQADYFNNTELSGAPIVSREEKNINYDYGMGSPDPAITNDNFSARWTGNLMIQDAGDYKFITFADDGVRLYIDDNLVIDNWQNQTFTRQETTLSLSQGAHTIKVEYFEFAESGGVKLFWERPGSGVEEPVPASYLTH
ncbi:MAG TPA: PA14 domain-containing protein [Candidatus Dojkabacteria bacterium]|jgi:hypothetical protein